MNRCESPGSCGELFQGKVAGIPIHITCPIDRYSRATAKHCHGGVKVPPGKRKVKSAIEVFLKRRGLRRGVEISLSSDLMVGKGMSSSSADIFAALSAVAELFSSDISQSEMASIALAVEPTDGVFLDGIAVFDHYSGLLAQTIGLAPRIGVVLLDFGGSVETIDFASQSIQYSRDELVQLEEAFTLVGKGIIKQDYYMIGAGSVLSARVNQKHLFKPYLEAVISAAAAGNAYGVNVAHSGTMIGVLADAFHLDHYLKRFTALFPLANVSGANIVNGGVRNNVYGYC